MCEEQRCKTCRQSFPATKEFFYVTWRTKKGEPRLGKDCRACTSAITGANKRKREQLKAQGLPVRIEPKKKPKAKQSRLPVRERSVPLPSGLPRLTAWRGPVPAGYGAGT